MSSPTAPAVLTLVTGEEELLADRAVAAVVAGARAADPDVEVRDLPAAEVDAAAVLDLGSPSMFGGLRVLVVRGAHELTDAARDLVLGYVADPAPDGLLVVVQSGGPRGRKLADALTSAGAAVVRCPKVTRVGERVDFVLGEFRAADRRATTGACRALVESVGSDLRELAAVCRQLVSDTEGPVDEAAVTRYHRGRAETRGFDVADAAVAGNMADALLLLRAARQAGTDPVPIVAAVGSGLRDIARVRGDVPASPAAVAKALGMPPWKAEKVLRQSRGWTDEGLTVALQAVATADADAKGAAVDPDYALERFLTAVCGARRARTG